MNIVIDKVTQSEQGDKIVYLHFLDDDNNVVDTTSVAFSEDPDAFNEVVKDKFSQSIKHVLDLRDATGVVRSHLDKLAVSEATIDTNTNTVIYK
ncbi:MAG: hypothetical protein ABSG75_11090 [Syntrophales bacterium]|jgi:hypothetical protein